MVGNQLRPREEIQLVVLGIAIVGRDILAATGIEPPEDEEESSWPESKQIRYRSIWGIEDLTEHLLPACVRLTEMMRSGPLEPMGDGDQSSPPLQPKKRQPRNRQLPGGGDNVDEEHHVADAGSKASGSRSGQSRGRGRGRGITPAVPARSSQRIRGQSGVKR